MGGKIASNQGRDIFASAFFLTWAGNHETHTHTCMYTHTQVLTHSQNVLSSLELG